MNCREIKCVIDVDLFDFQSPFVDGEVFATDPFDKRENITHPHREISATFNGREYIVRLWRYSGTIQENIVDAIEQCEGVSLVTRSEANSFMCANGLLSYPWDSSEMSTAVEACRMLVFWTNQLRQFVVEADMKPQLAYFRNRRANLAYVQQQIAEAQIAVRKGTPSITKSSINSLAKELQALCK